MDGYRPTMRLTDDTARAVLADAWERWARRCAQMTAREWSTPTRCRPWDARALVAHVCPDPGMFDELQAALTDGAPAVADAADVLRLFNAPGGIAHERADDLAHAAVSDAGSLDADEAVARFTESARVLREVSLPGNAVIAYPGIGSTTLAVVAELALMESTVHLLDLADAVGSVEPSDAAVEAARDLLVAVPDAKATVEVLAGRILPDRALPAIR